jgi:uncharacterized NAD(P)/FAD-binding protein YdhS
MIDKGNFAQTVVIIGGGFSGTSLAAALLRGCGASTSVVLIERMGRPGREVAYGTQCGGHLLNVRARNMSAVADDSEHFLRWARLHYDCSVEADDYVPRKVFGRYAESVLQEALATTPARFELLRDEAVALKQVHDKAEISLRGGQKVISDKVVLALGNFPPADPKFPGQTQTSSRYISNPWCGSALDNISDDRSVLVVGSGLTSVDVAISLRDRGCKGKIHFLSRHGLLPQQHKRAEAWPAFWNDGSPCTARGLLRLIRSQARDAENQNSDWRAVIDSLRPFTQQIWQSLPLTEQRRFLRHLRAYWDVHRHRVAPQIGAMLAAELGEEQMQLHSGRIVEYTEDSAGVCITYRERHSGESRRLKVDRVINCTGPDSDLRRIRDPLLKNLLQQGLARPDSLSLGLDTADDGALIDARGVISEVLYTLGPLRKGNLWETTAVPEIRVQAAQLAVQLGMDARMKVESPVAFSGLAEIEEQVA